MYMAIQSIVLWSRTAKEVRTLKFERDCVNVITGPSQTGKSAIIPIIDYCLASEKCAIPRGRIRDTCVWYGIVLDTVEGQKLFARREPEDKAQTSEMYIVESEEVEIPQEITSGNSNTNMAKSILNRLAGLSDLRISTDEQAPFCARASFRDFVAFNFQPQNIIANPDIMFYKAESYAHREKLIRVFPFALGALTSEILEKQFELESLRKEYRKRRAELEAEDASLTRWMSEARDWVYQAIEFGFLTSDFIVPDNWQEMVDTLRYIASFDNLPERIDIGGIEETIAQLNRYRENDRILSQQVSALRQSYNELERLVQSSHLYGQGIRIQKERLALADWFYNRYSNDNVLSQLTGFDYKAFLDLVSALRGLEIEVSAEGNVSNRLEKERLSLRDQIEEKLYELNPVRKSIQRLERDSEKASREAFRQREVNRFIGRVQNVLQVYENAGANSELRGYLESLEQRIEGLRTEVSQADIEARKNRALNRVSLQMQNVRQDLDVEYKEHPVRLSINDLTVYLEHENRNDFLWEIGSGSNWLGYHVSAILGLHSYFRGVKRTPVAPFIVFDQPSQVYFPKRPSDLMDVMREGFEDRDLVAIRRVFKSMSQAVEQTDYELQIILLDHADESVWEDFGNFHLVEDWRQGALIPDHW